MFKIKKRSLALLLASSAITMSVQAGQNTTANTVTGRAPVATANISMTGDYPAAQNLMPNYNYTDADSDPQSGSSYRWIRDGATIPGAPTHNFYPLLNTDIGHAFTLGVVPRSVNSADPYEGVEAVSNVFYPRLDVSRWIVQGTADWNSANNHCLSIGQRLPTSAELQQLFVDATRATAAGQGNSQMCELYGWPLGGQCGGSVNYYWSSTPDSAGRHYFVYLLNGDAISFDDSGIVQVACIR
ncbi:MAG: hypothetical protein WA173_17960 [Pseudomonas sp.]|uniref:hypothetical protein n=1 Tax=Pseudomonas sp. TaxID=306 RepID=UPI003BB4FECA